MIEFVNAKINIGLQVTRRREDGYHDLQTLFYPVGMFAGTHWNPVQFCDILECCLDRNPEEREEREERTEREERGERGGSGQESAISTGAKLPKVILSGRHVDCPLEKNLVYKAAKLFFDETGLDGRNLTLRLEKHLPDGAGMGGGSADAAFTLRILASHFGKTDLPLETLAARLGADCAFFINNRAAYAEGIGDRLEPTGLDLSGYWLAVVKPGIYISTKEAFANIRPKPGEFDLRRIPELPIAEWRRVVKNDFEDSIFPAHPQIRDVKERLYESGALYASMTGSGSCVYGIFAGEDEAAAALSRFRDNATIAATYLLKM